MSVKKAVCVTFFALFFFSLTIVSFLGICFATGPCPALPPPTGTTVTADSEEAIWNAVNAATSGTTILIADGTYNLGAKGYYLWIDTPNVTLRSAGGRRDSVIFDDNYSRSEIITIAASDVTIADVTLKRAGTHPIHVVSTIGGDTLNTLIYNVHIVDPGQQAIKINPHSNPVHFTDDGVVACSTIELTDAGRAKVWELNSSCYTGGVDGHQSRGWVIRDNIIKGFWCPQGLSEHGVHFWTGSRDTIVERNWLINNTRGIGFGLRESGSGRTYGDDPCPDASGHVGHFDGIIRNNFIFAGRDELFASQYGADGGIALAQACGVQVLHNTAAFTQSPFAAMEYRFSNTDADLINNLVTHNLMDRGGTAVLSGNLSDQPLSLFVDGLNGDLHLKSSADAAINQAVAIAAGLCDDDFDNQSRPVGTSRDIGADEYQSGSTNTAPVAIDQWVDVEENATEFPITLAGSDADGDELTFTVTSGPANGAVSGTAPNLFYTPSTGYNGDDRFSFQVNDGLLSSVDATVYITVQASDSDGDGDSDNNNGNGGGCLIGSARR
ncbi:MAG: Ig-like domain-containing protein [Desulfobacteraceae bacterium]|jgi:hypothetical protein